MHSSHWVWQFVVKVLIYITKCVHSIMLEVVLVHIVIMQEHSSVHVLRLVVESDIVPVSRPDLMIRDLLVSEVLRQGQRQVSSF